MKIVLPGIPIAKARARTVFRNGKVHTYDSQEDLKKNNKIILLGKNQKFIDCGPLISYKIHFDFFFPYPPKINHWITLPHICKPDIDNCLKFYCDLLNGIYYQDDKQIVEISAKKLYSHQPRTEIEIMPIATAKLDKDSVKVMTVITPEILQDMINEFSLLEKINEDLSPRTVDKDFEILFTAAASLLVQFAKKYTALLNKLKKTPDITYDKYRLDTIVNKVWDENS